MTEGVGTRREVREVCQGNAQEVGQGGAEEPEVAAEARAPVATRSPTEPTTKEILQHNITHLPYRSWCPHCVRGRGKSAAHKARDVEKEGQLPTIAVDYHFLGEKEGDEKCLPCLAARDLTSRMTSDTVVQAKGVNKHVIEHLTDFVDHLGYKRIILRSDQEASIVDLCNAFKTHWSGDVVPERTPVEDSQSNGAIERCIQLLAA